MIILVSRFAGAKVSALRFRHYKADYERLLLMRIFQQCQYVMRRREDTTNEFEFAINRCWNKDRFTTAAKEPQKGLCTSLLARYLLVEEDFR